MRIKTSITMFFALVIQSLAISQVESGLAGELFHEYHEEANVITSCTPFNRSENFLDGIGLYGTNWRVAYGTPRLLIKQFHWGALRSSDYGLRGDGLFLKKQFNDGETYTLTFNIKKDLKYGGNHSVEFTPRVMLANGLQHQSSSNGCPSSCGNSTDNYDTSLPVEGNFCDDGAWVQPSSSQLINLQLQSNQDSGFDVYKATFTVNADYSSIYMTAKANTSEMVVWNTNFFDLRKANSNSNDLSQFSINGNNEVQQASCYGDPLKIQVPTAITQTGGYLVEISEWSNGMLNTIASNQFFTPIPNEIDLYNFMDTYASYADFQGGKSYKVKLAVWEDDNSGWIEAAKLITFEESQANFNFLNTDFSNTVTAQNGYQVEIEDFGTSNLYIDSDLSTCYDRYSISIQEFNIDQWTGGPIHSTGTVISHEAPTYFNLASLLPGSFVDNQVYAVKVTTSFPHSSITKFCRKIPSSGIPTINSISPGSILNSNYESSDTWGSVLVHTICPTGVERDRYRFNLDVVNEDRHNIQIRPIDINTWDVINSNIYSHHAKHIFNDWVLTGAPNYIDIPASDFNIWGLPASYDAFLFSISIGTPWAYQDFVFRIPDNSLDCIGQQVGPRRGMETMSVNIYPNPVSDQLSIEMGESYEKGEVRILNSIGQVVYEKTLENQIYFQVDSSPFAEGFYIVELKIDSEIIRKNIRVTK